MSRFLRVSKRSYSTSPFSKDLVSSLNPGGHVELQEADLLLSSDDDTIQPTPALPRCLQLMYEAEGARGRGVGRNLEGGMEAFAMAPLKRAHGWERERATLFLVDVRRELNDTGDFMRIGQCQFVYRACCVFLLMCDR